MKAKKEYLAWALRRHQAEVFVEGLDCHPKLFAVRDEARDYTRGSFVPAKPVQVKVTVEEL